MSFKKLIELILAIWDFLIIDKLGLNSKYLIYMFFAVYNIVMVLSFRHYKNVVDSRLYTYYLDDMSDFYFVGSQEDYNFFFFKELLDLCFVHSFLVFLIFFAFIVLAQNLCYSNYRVFLFSIFCIIITSAFANYRFSKFLIFRPEYFDSFFLLSNSYLFFSMSVLLFFVIILIITSLKFDTKSKELNKILNDYFASDWALYYIFKKDSAPYCLVLELSFVMSLVSFVYFFFKLYAVIYISYRMYYLFFFFLYILARAYFFTIYGRNFFICILVIFNIIILILFGFVVFKSMLTLVCSFFII